MKKISYMFLSAVPAFLFMAGAAFAADDQHGSPHVTEEIDPFVDVENALDIVHDAHGAHESAVGLPQMDPTWFASQLFWLAVVFVFLYIIFSKSVLPSLSSTIEGRRNQIETDLDAARRLKDEAEHIHSEYEKAIMAAKNQASVAYTDAEAAIKKTSDERLAELANKTTETIKDTDRQLQKSKEKALDDVDEITAEMVVMAVDKLTGAEIDLESAKAMISKLTVKTTLKEAA